MIQTYDVQVFGIEFNRNPNVKKIYSMMSNFFEIHFEYDPQLTRMMRYLLHDFFHRGLTVTSL